MKGLHKSQTFVLLILLMGLNLILVNKPAWAICVESNSLCVSVSETHNPEETDSLLEMPIQEFNLIGDLIYDFIWKLRDEHHIPISFIPEKKEEDDRKDITVTIVDQTLNELLNRVIAIRPEYRYQIISDRLVFYPITPKYDLTVQNVNIQSLGRRKAAQEYLKILQAQLPEFRKLVGTPIRGSPKAPIYSELVSLRKNGAVVEHFVDLLGEDPMNVFSVWESETSYRALLFYNIRRMKSVLHPQRGLLKNYR